MIRSAAYGNRKVEVPTGAKEVLVTFVAPAFVVVAIEGWGGTGLESRLSVGITKDVRKLRHLSSGRRPDAKGEANLGPVDPGDHTVYLGAPVGRLHIVPIETRALTLAAGETRVVFRMPRLYPLTARVPGERPHHFKVRPVGGGWETLPEMGTEVTWQLPAGDYEVEPWGGRSLGPSRRVSVPAQSEVVFREVKPDCLEVRLDGPGAFASAGLADGDRIVAIDGKELTGSRMMSTLRTMAKYMERVKLGIRRRGRLIELEIPGRLLRVGREEAGGRLVEIER